MVQRRLVQCRSGLKSVVDVDAERIATKDYEYLLVKNFESVRWILRKTYVLDYVGDLSIHTPIRPTDLGHACLALKQVHGVSLQDRINPSMIYLPKHLHLKA
ncbi:hypothetical protein WG66_009198, partial [Moniliophthora roreri]